MECAVPIRVFMVGKSDQVMAQMADEMGPEFAVTHNQDISRAVREFRPEDFDVVILGRALKPDDRQTLLTSIEKSGSRLPVITSLAPQGKLSAAHAKAAISGAAPGDKVLTAEQPDGKQITFTLSKPQDVTITLYTLSALTYKLAIRPVESKHFDVGRHTVAIPRTLADRFERKHLYVASGNGDAYLFKVPGIL
jgi:hypothetical protein